MKWLKNIFLYLIFTSVFFAQTVDGGFVSFINGDSYEVMVFTKMQSGSGTAGVVELEFSYDQNTLIFSNTPAEDIDYELQGDFASYVTTNITRPASNKIGINLITTGTPPPVPLTTTNTNIIKIIFSIDDDQMSTNLQWTKTNIAPAFLQPIYTIGSWIGIDEALPVELTNFEYQVLDSGIKLIWETVTETNNYGFDVERFYVNNDSVKISETIGFVQGHGTTNSPKNYEFTDSELPNSDEVSYRLKQIDNDGTFAYSKFVTVDLTSITFVDDEVVYEFAIKQNYPNPFNPSTTINFAIPEKGYVELKVYDILGQEVTRLIDGELSAGYHKVVFDGHFISSGIYFYRIYVKDKFNSVKKMMLVK